MKGLQRFSCFYNNCKSPAEIYCTNCSTRAFFYCPQHEAKHFELKAKHNPTSLSLIIASEEKLNSQYSENIKIEQGLIEEFRKIIEFLQETLKKTLEKIHSRNRNINKLLKKLQKFTDFTSGVKGEMENLINESIEYKLGEILENVAKVVNENLPKFLDVPPEISSRRSSLLQQPTIKLLSNLAISQFADVEYKIQVLAEYGVAIQEENSKKITHALVGNTEKFAVSCEKFKRLKFWNLEKKRKVLETCLDSKLVLLEITKNSKYLITVLENPPAIKFWDMATKELQRTIKIEAQGICFLELPSEKALLGLWDGTIILLDLNSLIEEKRCKAFKATQHGTITCMVFSQKYQLFICGGINGAIKAFEYEEFALYNEKNELSTDVTCLAIAQEDYLISGLIHGEVWVWSLPGLDLRYKIKELKKNVGGVIVSENQVKIAVVGDKIIVICELGQSKPINVIKKRGELEAYNAEFPEILCFAKRLEG